MSHPIRTIVAGVSQPADDDPTLAAAAELARSASSRSAQERTVPLRIAATRSQMAWQPPRRCPRRTVRTREAPGARALRHPAT
jgi:hypothetical protein